ncbi:MAG: hypothetical protein SFY95_11390 [Planctomycetota bacterium]|nr:hypothetical protein [Planctomycetota bacterium]
MMKRTLLEARIVYSRAMGLLLGEINRHGLDFILDQGKRTPSEAKWNATHCRVVVHGQRCEQPIDRHSAPHEFKPIGIAQSVHVDGLAQDLLLVKDGAIVNDRDAYAPLGAYWTGLDPMLRWGGNFKGFADLGHFSHEWQGRS